MPSPCGCPAKDGPPGLAGLIHRRSKNPVRDHGPSPWEIIFFVYAHSGVACPRARSHSAPRSEKALRRVRSSEDPAHRTTLNSHPMARLSPSPSPFRTWPRTRVCHSVWTVPVDGEAPLLRKLADLAARPRWAPDGKRLYYVSTAGDVSQIWSMNPDGSAASGDASFD